MCRYKKFYYEFSLSNFRLYNLVFNYFILMQYYILLTLHDMHDKCMYIRKTLKLFTSPNQTIN